MRIPAPTGPLDVRYRGKADPGEKQSKTSIMTRTDQLICALSSSILGYHLGLPRSKEAAMVPLACHYSFFRRWLYSLLAFKLSKRAIWS
jgi:hypothetical protein